MLARQLPCLTRSRRTLCATAAVAALAVPAAPRAAAPGSQAAPRHVSYLGYTFAVPRSWPVIDLARGQRTCVRFDLHAVYLGDPAGNQSCPSLLVGTTQAVLIQPAPGSAAVSSVEDPVAKQITATAPRIKVTATFDGKPGQIDQILASASLPSPVIQFPNPADAAAGPAAGQDGPAARPALSAAVADYHGIGFDACSAPDGAYMRAWRRMSPYRAIGVYIGGSDEACAQPNLTRPWLLSQAAAGWRFIPMYVGPQAEFGELSGTPGRQGSAAADDAVTQAERLGFGPWTPLYYDMEAYPPGQTAASLRFLSAWTSRLHALGYSSGIYSSSGSGITDLARQYFTHRYAMPDVIYDALWNGEHNTADPAYRAGGWAGHRRVHQYAGNVLQTYGGDTIDIDQDYVNVSLPRPAATSSASPAVTRRAGTAAAASPDSGLRYLR